MSYGRFAVIIFIALSGFSLGLGLTRSGWPGSSGRLLPRRDRHLAPAARRPFP
jgi:hypothetical protein